MKKDSVSLPHLSQAELKDVEAVRQSYYASKAAKEAKENRNTLPATPENSPPSTDDEGEGDTDCLSSPSSPTSLQPEDEVQDRNRLQFGALRSVFERKEEVNHKIDEASVEGTDKGREWVME